MPSKKPKEFIVRSVYPSKLDSFTKDGIYAGRFPTSFISSDAREYSFGTRNNNPSPKFPTGSGGLVDPYNNITKNRFEDTFRADSTAQNTLMMLVKVILGKKHEIVLDSREQYASDELRKQAVESVMSKQENQNIIAEIKKIENDVHFHERLLASETQKRVYGRSCLGVVIKGGRPVDLKVFASKNLGQVAITKDWKFDGVEYHDGLIEKKKFDAKDILYFTNLDFNVTPNTLYYGLSKLEGVAHASETKRIILEEDLKETAKGQWAGVGLIKGPGVTSSGQADTIINGFDPGKWNFTNGDITVEVHKIADNIDKLSSLLDTIDRYIIRGIGLPLPLMGFEDITNRATMQEVMQAYKETVVEFERSVLQSQLDSQWYDTLVGIITQQDPLSLEYKVCLEFQDLVFDTLKDKAEAFKLLEEAGIPIPLEEKLTRLGMDNLLDQIQELEKEQKAEEVEMMKTKAELGMKVAADAKAKDDIKNAREEKEHQARLKMIEVYRQKIEDFQ